jgi:hypothetical protein
MEETISACQQCQVYPQPEQAVSSSIMEQAKHQVDATQWTYRHAKQETMIKSVGMALTPPALVTSIGSALDIGIFEPAGIAAVLFIFAAKTLLDIEKAQSERATSPWSYVLDAANL